MSSPPSLVFSSLVADLDANVQSAFEDFSPFITIHPHGGGLASYDVPVVMSNPQFRDDVQPGSTTGSSILMLFIASATYRALVNKPTNGDTATLNSVDYDVIEVPVDSMGGATMHMRRRSKRWDL